MKLTFAFGIHKHESKFANETRNWKSIAIRNLLLKLSFHNGISKCTITSGISQMQLGIHNYYLRIYSYNIAFTITRRNYNYKSEFRTAIQNLQINLRFHNYIVDFTIPTGIFQLQLRIYEGLFKYYTTLKTGIFVSPLGYRNIVKRLFRSP